MQPKELVVVDVSGVEHVDPVLLRFLANLYRDTTKAQSSPVKLVGVKPRLRRVLEITGLMRMFEIELAEA
jgi:anti-anti-sigma factor